MENEDYNKKYYASHKDAYKTKYVKKVTCECCDHEMVSHNYNKHKKTDKYKNNMKNKYVDGESFDKMIEIIQNLKNSLTK